MGKSRAAKNKRRGKSIGLLCAVLALMLVFSSCSSEQSTEKVSEPFNYSGYSEAEYSGYTKTSQYVEMSDGTKIAVDIYLPADGPEQTAFPTIFQYTPYGRAYAIPDSVDISLVTKLGLRYYCGTWDNYLDRINSHDGVYGSYDDEIELFLSHGYAYICADMRGCGASYGTMMDFCKEFATDGKELIDWMAQQEWCDGNVGMFGGSYLGYSQLVTAAQMPEALKCIIPEVAPLDGYTGEIRPGGVFLQAYSENDNEWLLEQNAYLPDDYSYPTMPVIDEDGDGSYTDEIPIDKDGDGYFTDDYNYPDDPNDEPQYEDGNKREHIYYLATLEHTKNIAYSEIGAKTEYIDTVWEYNGEEMTPYSVSPSAGISNIMESGIAVYNFGGWMDAFVRGTTELYATLKDTNPSRMIIGAGYHMETSPYWEYCGEDEDEMIASYNTEKLRFFDRYLKGIENGIDTEDPILIYNMNGDGWRTESEWPLARQQETDFYLGESNTLSAERSADGSDVYTVDFTTTSIVGDEEKGTRYLMETPDELPIRTEEDEKCLTYTSAALEADTEVTGYPIITLYVSSTAETGDFYVYLEDVDEDGEAVLVTDGVLNAKYSALQDNDDMILGGTAGVDVEPELPWHGYEESDCNATPFADGNIVELTLDLMPTSWTFKAGHRIRVTIACADYCTFELTPELCPSGDPADESTITPDITIYRDSEHQSKITLPVIPE